MQTAPHTRIGGYEIVSLLGSGGMGEVYRARDEKLNRDVAIKLLPDGFAHDQDRVARFAREAQTLAALNHPNIAHIYGIVEAPAGPAGDAAHVHALVMELVEGDDLSDVIARGAVPLADAIPIARQIADALEAAHEHGIVHRDLKPANVKIRRDGTVKVLDFGLAKAVDPPSASGLNAANSPTLTDRATRLGTVIGTAAYMAPEQARGKPADRRADIWAFGVVLFEMLTGRRAFDGDDASDALAAVLKTEPPWDALPGATPPAVRRLLRRCLEKDPRRRLSAIGDARLELDDPEPAAPPVTATATSTTVPRRGTALVSRLWPPIAAALVTALVVLVVAARLWPAPGPVRVTRLSILAPPGTSLFPDSTGVAMSPDGTMVAFLVGSVAQSESELWIRSLDSVIARRLDTGAPAYLPFWSPDSRQIGVFTTDGKLRTVAVAGGHAQVLCDTPGGRGAVWTASNEIVFAPDAGGPLYRISANGGTPTPVTRLDPVRKEYGHRFPTLLPDGRHFLYVALPGKNGQFNVFAGSLVDSSRTFVGSMESAPVYADPGWLLSTRQGVLAAQRFDPATLKLTGDPVTLDDEPSSILEPTTSFTAGRPVSISAAGSLAYFSTPSPNTTAEWYDAGGRKTGTLGVPPGHYDSVRIAPDGRHAVLVRSTSPSESTLWLVDLARGTALPLSSGRGRNDSPVWSPDGTRIVFSADRDGPQDMYVKNVGDGSAERPLYRSDVPFKDPVAWSSDGKWIVMVELDAGTKQNVWLLPASGGSRLEPLVTGPAREQGGWPSPDGRWLAYTSDETGQSELFVQSFPTPGHKIQVSQTGAQAAWWTRDGRQLVFVAADLRSLWRVDVASGPTLDVGTPTRMAFLPPDIVAIDATPDRQRFLAIAPDRTGIGSVTVVQNWRAALGPGR